MEIKLNTNLGPVGSKPVEAQAKSQAAPAARAAIEFGGSAALERALASTPEVRADVVARAKMLVADISYPPNETIHKISNLLALHLRDDSK